MWPCYYGCSSAITDALVLIMAEVVEEELADIADVYIVLKKECYHHLKKGIRINLFNIIQFNIIIYFEKYSFRCTKFIKIIELINCSWEMLY